MPTTNNYPKLHNAAWPGLVGKGPDSEPPIDLDTMIASPPTPSRRREIRRHGPLPLRPPHQHRYRRRRPQTHRRQVPRQESGVGSVVAPIWPPTGGGAAMGTEADRKKFVEQVTQGCRIAEKLRAARRPPLRRRPHGLRHQSRRVVQGPAGKPEEDRRDVSRGGRCRRRLWRATGRGR